MEKSNTFLGQALPKEDVEFTIQSISLVNGSYIWAWVYVSEDGNVLVKDGVLLEFDEDYDTGEVYTKFLPINTYSDEPIQRINQNFILTMGEMIPRVQKHYEEVLGKIRAQRVDIAKDSVKQESNDSNVLSFTPNRVLH